MLRLTKRAAQELKIIQEHVQRHLSGGVPRLLQAEVQFELAIDVPKEGDHVLYYADEKVLVMDAETSGILAGVTLECEETPQGPALVLEVGP